MLYKVYQTGYPEERQVIDIFEDEDEARKKAYEKNYSSCTNVKVIPFEPKEEVGNFYDPHSYKVIIQEPIQGVNGEVYAEMEVNQFEEARKYIEMVNKVLNEEASPEKVLEDKFPAKAETEGDKNDIIENLESNVKSIRENSVPPHFKIKRISSKQEYLSDNLINEEIPEEPWKVNWNSK